MVSDTRSARRSKEEADDSSTKKKVNFRKDPSTRSTDVSGARSARETSSSRPTTPNPKSRAMTSPQIMRKSKRLDKGLPALTPPMKRKSERLEKHNTPSPVRRSDRGKKNLASNASGSKQPAKELSSSGSKRRKEKTLIELTTESKKSEVDLEAVGNKKRKMMDGRSFRSLFKKQRIKDIVLDGDGDLEGRDKLSDVCSGNSKGVDSKTIGNDEDISDECNRGVVGNLRDESIDKTDNEATQKSVCSSKDCHTDIENDVIVDSGLGNNVVGQPSSKDSQTSLSVQETFDNTERSSNPDNIDSQKSVRSSKGCHAGIENDIIVDSGLGDNIVVDPCSKDPHTSLSVRELFDNTERSSKNCLPIDNIDAQKSVCSLKGCHTDIKNDVIVDSGLGDNVVVDSCSKDSLTSLSVRETFDNTERWSKNCLSTDNIDAQKSVCSLKGCHTVIEHDVIVDSRLGDNVMVDLCSKDSHTSLSVREMFNNTERSSKNCLSTDNIDAPESESSTSLARSQDGSASSVAETTPSPSSKCESCDLLGTCVLCSKIKRVRYDSPEQELCSCNSAVCKELDRISTCKCKDRSDQGAAVTSESAEKCDSRHLLKERRADSQINGHENVCALCDKGGELLWVKPLCCEGKGCRRCYHLSCLDPPLNDALPGVWHCSQCVKKKILFGVHSVSEGVESIWDVREVGVSNAEGVRQRQYLVKYHGLAHIHNHWVPETQLLLEYSSLVSNFVEKDQAVKWSPEWMVPHRLLLKRCIQDKIYVASSDVISVCNYEWLVKWAGLSYDHATWELEDSYFLSSPLGQKLVKDYEIRCQKAKQGVNKHHKGSIVKLSELPASQSLVNDNDVLKNVNKLREFLLKGQNAVAFNDQEQAVAIILFIRSMSEIGWPFLVVTASSSVSQWEAEFARLVPSVDVVVYSGNRNTRKGIRASEFNEGGSRVMFQVLLSSAEAVFEDLDRLRSIKWEAIVIDGYKQSELSIDLEQIRILSTELRILILSGQIKESTSEYLKILSLLESDGDFDKLAGLKSDTNENICKLKDRLSRFIANGSTSQVSRLIEYWLPVQMSNFQLEEYCDTLLSNSIYLRSCSKNDHVGALQDILLTVRKCCDHPYLLDSSVQGSLIAEQRPAAEILDYGVKASGKLELLDSILTEIKMRGLRVLVLYQLIIGSGGASTGDILDDFLRQRFGQHTYERIDAGVLRSKKQAALNRFNKKETEQFVFLLETRACASIIKLSSVDVIIIFDSDWNPANDLRALQKISIDSKVEHIKVFRLYSSFTVEERALILAKQNLNLDNNLQNFSRTTSNTLLRWGAMYLFSKLDEYHADNKSNLALNVSSGQLLLNEVVKEFKAILSGSENTDSNSIISKVKLGVGSYNTNVSTLGETKLELKDEEEPHIFWRNLLDGKNPQWKHLKGPCRRNRKRVNYLDGSPSKLEAEKHDVSKKRKKMLNKNPDPAIIEVELGVHQVTQVAVPEGGHSTTIKPCNQSQDLQSDSTPNNKPNSISVQSSFGDEAYVAVSEEKIVSSDEKKSLHNFLQGEMMRLCQILKVSEEVTNVGRRFLDYVMKNHHFNSDSPSIVQAFQISLYWNAASITKQKVDKKNSLVLAEQLLNYQCTEEQVSTVYLKMRSLKRNYLQCSENNINSGSDCLIAEEDISKESSINEWSSQSSSHNARNLKNEIREKFAYEEHAEGQVLLQQKVTPNDNETASCEIINKLKKIQKKCDKRTKKLERKHQQEIQEFHRVWEEKRVKLETDHKLESAFIRSIHGQGSVRVDKLKLLDTNFAKKMEEYNLLKDVQFRDLEAEQLAATNEERQKAALWLDKAKVCSSEVGTVNRPHQLGSQSGGDAAPSITSSSPPAEAIDPKTPVENSGTACAQNGGKVVSLENSSSPMVEHLNLSNNSSDKGETVSADLPAPVEKVSDEIQPVELSEECPIEVSKTVANKFVGHVHPVELSDASKESSDQGSGSALPNALVSQKDGTDETSSGELLQSPGQTLVRSEQTVAMPDCSDLFAGQVQQDKLDQSLAAAEIRDLDAPAVENQCTSEVARSALVDTVAPSPSIPEATVIDQVVTPIPTNLEAPVTDEVVNPVSSNLESPVDISLSCNQSPTIEDHDQGRSSSQTVEPRVTGVAQESISRSAENVEIRSSGHLDIIVPMTGVAHTQGVELSDVCQNDIAITQGRMGTAGQPNQAGLQLETGAGHGPNYFLAPPAHRHIFRNSAPSFVADPLQYELERIRKETEQLEKNHENMMSQINSDCEKEIEEIITQIRKKYEVKLQESKAEFRLKRNELETNQNIVHMNKVLAEAFRLKCRSKGGDPRASGLPVMEQGVSSLFMPRLPHYSMAPPARSSPGPSQQQITAPAGQTLQQQVSRPPSVRPSSPGSSQQQITAPAVQTVQQQVSRPSSVRPFAGPSLQQITAPAVQTVQQQVLRPPSMRPSIAPGQSVAAAATPPLVQAIQDLLSSSSSSSRPPLLISSITPTRNPPRHGCEIRSRAPHLQPFRPAASIPYSSSPLQQMQPSQPGLQTTPRPPGPQTQAPPPRPPLANPSVPTVAAAATDRCHNNGSSNLPEICSTFGTLELSDLESISNVQDNQTSRVVCLSDDE
ncbi:hypothetical protein ABFS83_14G242600 [Erythranthe nasuta]